VLKLVGMSFRGRGVANRWKARLYGRRQPDQKEQPMQPPNQTTEIKVLANLERRTKRSQTDPAERDRIALEMHQAGTTWEKVAEAIGFANGAIARRAALRHHISLNPEGIQDPQV